MRHVLTLTLTLGIAFLTGCSSQPVPDATGTFEANETLISSEVGGKLINFSAVEGAVVSQGQTLAQIDTVQLVLKRQQLAAQIAAVLSRKPEIQKQVAAFQEQLRGARRELERAQRLKAADAATQKQVDDAQTQVDVLQKQIDAQLSTLTLTSSNLEFETRPLLAQIQQIDDQLNRTRIEAPFTGTVLTTYVEPFEVVGPGKALLRMANIDTLTLRAYVSGDQLSTLKLGATMKVQVDDGSGGYRPYSGILSWVSAKAEFTPKSIQTKNERANLVYAIKIRVPNDQQLKIGMYAEVELK